MTFKKPMRADIKFVLFSMALHALLVTVLLFTEPAPIASKSEKIEFEIVEEPTSADATVAEKKKTRTKDVLTKQIVEQQEQINDELDEKTRFLSAFNQKVLQQTQAQRSGEFKNTAGGGKPDEGRKDGDKKAKSLDRSKRKSREKGELPDLRDLAPKFALTPGPRGMKPDNGDPSQTDDYLKDVQTGLQTLLSTREFVYYSYYNRIKEALRHHWEPNVREKVKIIYRQGRSIASAKDRITQVLVILNPQGELIRVEVVGKSGVDSLDDAAVEAFESAAPFPNPPKGMIEKDGTIKIRWDFVLEA